MKKILILLGPPGAGKGTQAILIAEKLGITHISTGDMFREAIASESELGLEIRQILDRGDLVPDETVVRVIAERIQAEDCAAGFLMDGFPRTLEQAQEFDKLLSSQDLECSAVVELDVPEDKIIERISKRAQESGRTDDSLEVLSNRLKVYWEQTAPLISYYQDQGKLKKIKGLGTIEEVNQRVMEELGE